MSRIKVPKDLADWNDAGEEYLPGLLGIEFTDVGDGEVRARMAVRKSLLAWNGFMHAGSIVSLADTACGYGTVNSLPEDAVGFTTLELPAGAVIADPYADPDGVFLFAVVLREVPLDLDGALHRLAD